ncbi:hypothetical protein VP01_3983g3 [Puccinia sorghi]|uniref:Uncharacterized protein n=1 Tax=Puccinia sorghi TaxID=27349 RepID=A0A0L6UT31_9BASI|nr:hypothetical protein VP01_3983g3 [Puccinia sorghi]
MTSKPVVLDSGATHHLVNNPDAFQPTAESNIKIATRGHSNFLNATVWSLYRRGVAAGLSSCCH